MSSADDILLNAAITSAAGTAFDSFMAPKCFVAGTMVATAAGLVAIENISIGDQVLAQNPETGEIAYKEVLDTFRNETNVVVHVTVNDETFTCTEEHPFYVEGKGWVNASALRVGMVVWLADGTKAIIQDVWIEYLAEAVAVFNFKVADFHTYFVGYSGVLVHNANCGTSVSANDADTKPKDLGNEPVDIELKYKEGWTAEQRAEADAKVQALSEAYTVKTQVERKGTASTTYKATYGANSVPTGYDVDHTIDLQLGGANDILNMNPLDKSVNRSLGVQIMNAIKGYDYGTVFGKFTIS